MHDPSPHVFRCSHPRRGLAVLALVLALQMGQNTVCVAQSTPAMRDALASSLLFYEAQRSGPLDKSNRVQWRGSSGLKDKGPKGEDLTGGLYDAGDTVKLGFPFAFTASMLAWGLLQWREGYVAAGQLAQGLKTLTWFTDYMVKCHTSPNTLYVQVGDMQTDHDQWGRPEETVDAVRRPAFAVSPTRPGADVASATAAALAAASLVFSREGRKTYAASLLTHASQLQAFARRYPGLYSNVIPIDGSYPSSSYWDDLAWGAVWLYKATNDSTYLDQARTLWSTKLATSRSLEFGWDSKIPGVAVLLAEQVKPWSAAAPYRAAVDSVLKGWEPKGRVKYVRGLATITGWGSIAASLNVALLACVYSDSVLTQPPALATPGNAGARALHTNWAKSQLLFALGSSGRSYVVGLGKNWPTRPHHAAASCRDPPTPCTWDDYDINRPNPHVLTGAVVGGPDMSGVYRDVRSDYQTNEPALDYNAAFTGLTARYTVAA